MQTCCEAVTDVNEGNNLSTCSLMCANKTPLLSMEHKQYTGAATPLKDYGFSANAPSKKTFLGANEQSKGKCF